MRRFPLPVLTAGLVLGATSALALPTDMGRSADVYTNAVRYFAARADNPAAWPTPKERPATFASLATSDTVEDVVEEAAAPAPVPLTAPQNQIAGAPAPVIASAASARLTVAPVLADAAPSLAQPEAQDVAAETASGATLNQVAQAAAPELISPAEAAIVETDVADAANDLAAEVAVPVVAAVPTPNPHPAIVAIATVVADAQEAPADESAIQAAADVAAPEAPSAGSSRQTVSPHPELTFAADVTVAEPEVDLMSRMADADENLIVRDGGEDGPDTMMMSSDVLFSFGQATLADDALTTLASIGDMVDNVPVIQVLGHTDAIGSEVNNLALGQRRAEAVRDWLLQNTAFTEDRIVATGIGEVDPVAPNLADNGDDNPEGRAQNRRVEFAFHEADFVPE